LFSVEAGSSNQFIIDHMKNVRRGLESKLEKGVLPCLPPIGYLNEPHERTIVQDPERFGLIRKMWDLMLTGAYSPSQILKIASSDWGLRSRKTKRTGNKPLSLSKVYNIFTSKFYTGIIEYGDKEYAGSHQKMVTLDEYDRVQVLLGRKGRPRPKKYLHAFTGLIRCGDCGAFVTAETKTKLIKSTGDVATYVYYHCTKNKKYVHCSQKGSLKLEDLEGQIDTELARYEIIPEFRDWALDILNKLNDQEVEQRSKVFDSQQKALSETQQQLDRLTQMRYRDLINDEEYLKEKENLTQSVGHLKEKVRSTQERAEQWLDVTERAFNFASKARRAFQNGDTQVKREIFMGLGQNPTLKDGILSITASEWLRTLNDGYEPIQKRYSSVITKEKKLAKPQTSAKASVLSEWWRWRESNPRGAS